MSKYEWDNHKDTNFSEFERFFRDSNIQPIYDTRSDYTTNAPSFYEYLSRHNHLIKILAKRIYDYDKELAKRFEEWDKRIENLPKELEDLLIEWLNDGTLENIINENIFNDLNNKIDTIDNDFKTSFFYDEITTTKEFKDNCGVYYVTTIPKTDKKGNPIYLEKEFSNNNFNSSLENVIDHSIRNKTSLTVNASIFNTNTNQLQGIHIKDSQVYKDDNDNKYYILGYKKDTQELEIFNPTTTVDELLNNNVTDTWYGFIPLIQNSIKVDESLLSLIVNEKHPRQIIAQMNNKDIKIFTCEGRTSQSKGFDYNDMIELVLSYNVRNAYVLDGGGSLGTVKSGILKNTPLDNGNVRNVADFINVKKPTNKAYEDFYKEVTLLSSDIKRVLNNSANKNGDRFTGSVYFDNFVYHTVDKPIYFIDKNGKIIRFINMADLNGTNRFYIGNIDNPMTIQSKGIPTIQVDGVNNDMLLYDKSSKTKVSLNTGFSHMEYRNLEEKYINSYMSNLSGAIKIPQNVETGAIIGTLKTENRPQKQMVIPVASIGGEMQHNEVILHTNGNIQLRKKPEFIENEDFYIQIETMIFRG